MPETDPIAFSERLTEAMKHAGREGRGAGSWLAKRYSISGPTAHGWLKGLHRPTSDKVRALAQDLKVNFDWLMFGIGSLAAANFNPDALRNVSATPISRRKLALLTHVQAGRPQEYIDDFAAGGADDYVEVEYDLGQTLGPCAFALIVEGPSMIPEFYEGDRVIIDPAQAVYPGAFVVAKIEKYNGATLKKYQDRGSDEDGYPMFDLVPLNPDFSIERINSKNPGSIIGVVVEKRKRYR